MPVNNQQLPYQVTSDAISGGNTRAIQNTFMSQAREVTLEVDAFYVEPFVLNVGNEQPLAIRLDRIVQSVAPETPVLCGDLVHFSYRPDLGGAQITSIDGLSPSTDILYHFVFCVKFKAQV
jgi:hypothetical protein